MKLILYDRFTIKTHYTPEDIEDKVRKNMCRDIYSHKKYFCGSADRNGFKLNPTLGKNGKISLFNPVVRGEISVQGSNSQIKVTMEPLPALKAFSLLWVLAFLVVFMFMIPFVLFGAIKISAFITLVCIAAAGYGAVDYMFWRNTGRARRNLYKILK